MCRTLWTCILGAALMLIVFNKCSFASIKGHILAVKQNGLKQMLKGQRVGLRRTNVCKNICVYASRMGNPTIPEISVHYVHCGRGPGRERYFTLGRHSCACGISADAEYGVHVVWNDSEDQNGDLQSHYDLQNGGTLKCLRHPAGCFSKANISSVCAIEEAWRITSSLPESTIAPMMMADRIHEVVSINSTI